jgi:hypothetical protein
MDDQACPENRDKPKTLTTIDIDVSADPGLGATSLDIWARLSIPDGKLLPR